MPRFVFEDEAPAPAAPRFVFEDEAAPVSEPRRVAAHGPPESIPRAPRVSVAESGIRGALQGASMGWADEAAAGLYSVPGLGRAGQWVDEHVLGNPLPGAPYGKGYALMLEYLRRRNATAEEANPSTYLAGQVGGAAAPLLVGAPATGGRALLAAAGQGAAQGAGYSEANEARGLASDTALGTALGLAGHGAGKVVGKGAAAAVRKGRDLIRSGTARAGGQAAEEAADALASQVGKTGKAAEHTNRQIEWIIRMLDEESSGTISPANRSALEAFRQSPAYADLVNAASEAVLQKAPQAAGALRAQQAKLAAMQADLPQAIQARTAELLKPQVGADTKSFLKAYAEPLVWMGGANALGSVLDLTPTQQAALVAGAGVVGGRTRAGKALMTRLKRPAHQTLLGRFLERAGTTPQTPLGRNLLLTLERGGAAGLTPFVIEDEQ